MRVGEAFFRPGRIVTSWTDTPAGARAARRALTSDTYADGERTAPIGRILTRYTLEHYAMVAAEITPAGTKLLTYGAPLAAPGTNGHGSPLDVEFRVGIREWSCLIPGENGGKEIL